VPRKRPGSRSASESGKHVKEEEAGRRGRRGSEREEGDRRARSWSERVLDDAIETKLKHGNLNEAAARRARDRSRIHPGRSGERLSPHSGTLSSNPSTRTQLKGQDQARRTSLALTIAQHTHTHTKQSITDHDKTLSLPLSLTLSLQVSLSLFLACLWLHRADRSTARLEGVPHSMQTSASLPTSRWNLFGLVGPHQVDVVMPCTHTHSHSHSHTLTRSDTKPWSLCAISKRSESLCTLQSLSQHTTHTETNG